MIVFVSDIHFGRSDPDTERRLEANLIACLRALEPDAKALYLVGDVFEQYIEYGTLVPKGFVRFQGLLAEWTDSGRPATYLVGNHDPWHRDYFERELGVRLVFDDLCELHYGWNVYMAHGDGLDTTSRLYNRIKPMLRHPIPVRLYRTLLPGDAGFRLARWYSRTFGTETLQPERIEQVRAHARQMLTIHNADLAVFGHTHQEELTMWPEGAYLNPGCWYAAQTLGVLDPEGPRLMRWHEGTLECINH